MPSPEITTAAAIPPDTLRREASPLSFWLLILVLAGLAGIFIAQLHLDWSLNPSYSYGWVVPFLAGYCLWNRWSTRPAATPMQPRSFAIALICGCALLLLPLRIFAKANPDWRLVSWGLGICLAGTALAIFFAAGGLRWMQHFAFPVLFCLVAIPWPTQFEQNLVQ